MTERLDLPRRYREQIEALLREHVPGVEVWAYGSRVSGRSHEGSDLDLVLRRPGLKRIPSGQLADLIEALEESTVPIIVQTHDWARLPESFHREIEREYVVVQEEKLGIVSDGWGSLRLGDVCTKIGSGATPRGGQEVYLKDGPYALIRSQNVHNNRFNYDGLAFINQQQATALDNVEVFADDVLLNITGDSVARACQVASDVLPARVNQHVAIIRPDPNKLSPRFLRYFLVRPEIQAMLLSWAGAGGTRNALTKGMIESLDVQAPMDVAEQRAIAHILGTLDDKIELNRRMNETLEEMARALFKSWFVDFEPVRDKMAGKIPDFGLICDRMTEKGAELPKRIADLFPDRLVDSELGEIPEGWEVGVLDDAIELLSGGTPRTSVASYWDGDIPWYAAKDAPALSDVFVLDTERTITQAGVENSSTKILPVGTTIITARGTVGRLACLGVPMAMNQTCYGIRGARSYPDFFTYWIVRKAVDELQSRTHGTIFDTITRQTFKIVDMVLPPVNVAEAFECTVNSIMERILNNLHESHSLAALRDTLLPKLVSGELRVDETERFIGRSS